MIRLRIDLALLAVGFALASAAPAFAQGYPSPALSPWFNLYQKQAGPLDNYNMFVQPAIQMQNTLQRQQFDLQRQAAGSYVLGQQISQLDQNRMPIATTGTAAGFMNQGRYFGVQSTTNLASRPLPGGVARRNWSPPPASTSAPSAPSAPGR